MEPSPLLGPVIALVLWSILMLFWLAFARAGGIKHASGKPPKGVRGQDLDAILPRKANWPAHNYQHLMEQPTIFYATVLALVAMGFDAWINVWLAWGYVGLRIAHSIVQATVNNVAVRFTLFLLSTLCLLSLAIHGALRLWH